MPRERDEKGAGEGEVRIVEAERRQVELRVFHLDGMIPGDHPVRAIWAFVEGVDLSGFYEDAKSLEGRAGRPAIDRKILLALWLCGTIEGVGSARALDRPSKGHVVYQWICGGVGVNYYTLADFRVRHEEAMDDLLTQSVASLMNEGLVELKRVAQDGIKVRASAGASSFRRKKTLRERLKQAKEQVRSLRQELEEDPGAGTRREQAARERAARDRADRVKKALERARELEKKRPKEKDKEAVRASTSDPQARVMKMGDGGWRPAYNVQLATETPSQIIVGVEVTNQGNDQGQIEPMIDQRPGTLRSRTGGDDGGRWLHGTRGPGDGGRPDDGLRARAEAEGPWNRPASAEGDGLDGDRGRAQTDEDGASEADLQGEGLDSRVRQRSSPQPRAHPGAGARDREGPGRGPSVRPAAQPEADALDGLPDSGARGKTPAGARKADGSGSPDSGQPREGLRSELRASIRRRGASPRRTPTIAPSLGRIPGNLHNL